MPTTTDRHRAPSTRWYRFAAAVLAVGLVLAFGWFLHALTVQTNAVNEFTDVSWFPGSTVEVVVSGDHTLWTGPACSGACRPESADTYRRHFSAGFEGPDGRPVQVVAAAEQYFNVGSGREGRAVWVARFDEPGTYSPRLAAIPQPPGELGVPRPRLWLSPGQGLPIRAARGSLFLTGGFALAAASIAAAVFVLRRRAFDRMPPALA